MLTPIQETLLSTVTHFHEELEIAIRESNGLDAWFSAFLGSDIFARLSDDYKQESSELFLAVRAILHQALLVAEEREKMLILAA